MADMQIGTLAKQITHELAPLYGEGEAKAMTRLIFQSLKGWSQTQLIINYDQPASEYLINCVATILNRLSEYEPLQYILGQAYFYGMNLKVDSSTLIPRPETEELVDLIVRTYQDSKDLDILDIGTGSGAIAIALARNLPFSNVSAIDISTDAISVAKSNAESLNAKIEFEIADIFKYQPAPSSLDIMVSNPPYIDESEKRDMDPNVLDYEPHTALFVPDSAPLIFYNRISELAVSALKPGGALYFEINPRHSAELAHNLKTLGFVDIEIVRDIHQRNRFIKAKKE